MRSCSGWGSGERRSRYPRRSGGKRRDEFEQQPAVEGKRREIEAARAIAIGATSRRKVRGDRRASGGSRRRARTAAGRRRAGSLPAPSRFRGFTKTSSSRPADLSRPSRVGGIPRGRNAKSQKPIHRGLGDEQGVRGLIGDGEDREPSQSHRQPEKGRSTSPRQQGVQDQRPPQPATTNAERTTTRARGQERRPAKDDGAVEADHPSAWMPPG